MKNIEHDRNRLLEELKRIAVMHGGECLSTRYLDTKTKLRWRCVKGHEWFALPWNVRRGHWCEICGNERQGRAKAHTIELMRQVADSKGGQCLSPNYRNNTTSLRWRCGHGHEWNAAPGSIVGSKGRKGSWCPVCAGKLPKDVALAELNKLASMRDGSLLSKRYENAKTRMRWECAKGHVWVATADSVKRGSWCPVCGGSYPLSLEQMQKAAQGFGGMCLSADYVNSKTPLSWQCVEGHEWEAKAQHVLDGHWCPICSAGVSERICRALVERMTGGRFQKQRPTWLRNRRGKLMELDGYAPELKLAFEYHGPQHYNQVTFFHAEAGAFAQRQEDDERKRQLCREHGVTLLEVPHHVPHAELQRYLANLLRATAPSLPCDDTPVGIEQLGVWKRTELDEMRSLAISRGGQLLSNYYINSTTKLRWRCADGHEWEAMPFSVKRGSWCQKCGFARSAIKRAHTIEEMQMLAAAKGGVCLSSTYANGWSKLRWRCASGHEWETPPSVILGGHWCRKCESLRLGRKYALTLQEVQKTAGARGGECLSDSYLNAQQKLRWRCAKGHEWSANTNSIRRGTWCPVCAGKRPK